MITKEKNGDFYILGIECLDLDLTLDCGEAFRWEKQEDDSWSGVAFGKFLNIKKEKDAFVLKNTSKEDFENIWKNYFDLERDYKSICKELSKDKLAGEAINDFYGIRILNQDPFEALVSFIISQQNNIKRIKGIIKRLCETYGEEIGDGEFSFPSAKKLSSLSVLDFEKLGTGYRAKYLKKFADDVYFGNINLDEIKNMPLNDARETLLKIYGVGIKVANCALLFGFHFLEAFPIDVWMKRIMEFYPDGLPKCFENYEGIAQQYLFHWARNNLKE